MSNYAISDLHGNKKLWERVKAFLKPEDTLYVLGDCADRLPDGWDIIKDCLKMPNVVYIRGNHEQMLIDAWKEDFYGDDLDLWLYNGGYSTFGSLMADVERELFISELIKSSKLMDVYINKNGQTIYLSHAGFTPGGTWTIPDKYNLIWDRKHIEDTWPKEHKNEIIIHGHTPIRSRNMKLVGPIGVNESKTVLWYADNHKCCIDAGTYITNKAAMIDLDTFKEIVFEEN